MGLVAAVACKPLEPDPVIRNGVDLGPIQSFEVERIPGAPGIGSVSDPSAGDTHALEFLSNATGELDIELLTDVSGFVLRARADECKGWPEVEVDVDGQAALKTEIKSRSWTDVPVMRPLTEGTHHFAFRFTNDKYDPPCDRNLYLDKVTFVNTGTVSHGDLSASSMMLPAGITVEDDPQLQNHKIAAFMSAAAATGLWRVDRPATGLVVRARADLCDGPPELVIGLDQTPTTTIKVTSTAWADYRVPMTLSPGVHSVSLEFPNDEYKPDRCDRNLYLDTLRAEVASPATGATTSAGSASGSNSGLAK